MPRYLYQHPESGEVVELIQTMSEKHEFEKDGVKWNRLFTPPQMNFDVRVDPYSPKDFNRVTEKKGTIGDLWDRSAELSHDRASKNGGIDPIKQEFFKKYSDERGGTKHQEQLKQGANIKLKNAGFSTID